MGKRAWTEMVKVAASESGETFLLPNKHPFWCCRRILSGMMIDRGSSDWNSTLIVKQASTKARGSSFNHRQLRTTITAIRIYVPC